jgi:hypothetical protein
MRNACGGDIIVIANLSVGKLSNERFVVSG